MKKIYLILLFMILFFVSGCAANVTEFTYEDSGITIGGDTLYYRNYTVSTSCDIFDVFLVYEEDIYYYAEAYSSMAGSCSSGLYVSDSGEYVELRYAYSIGAYDEAQTGAVNWGITIYPSSIVPSQVTLAALLAEIEVSEKQIVYSWALAVENAANLYCAQTTCTITETLTWTQLSVYIEGFPTSEYDLSNNGGIVASLSLGLWGIDLERVGTGEWEFTEGNNPSSHGISSIIVDID